MKVEIKYWTGMMYCMGNEVGGTLTVEVTPEEKALLDAAEVGHGDDFDGYLEEKLPDLLDRVHDMAGHEVNVQMAEDYMGDFNFDDEEYEGWTHEDKVEYIIDHMNGSVDDICNFTYEYEKE